MRGLRRTKGFRRWLVSLLMAALALATVSGSVLAASPRRGEDAAPRVVQRPDVRYGLRALDLTDEQIRKIAEIRQKAEEQAIPIRGELFTLRQQLALALRSAQVDANKVKELASRINDLEGQLEQIRLQVWLDIRGVLTDEQRAKLGTFMGLGILGGPGFGRRGGFGLGPCGGYGMMGPGRHM